jgi:hypothetical protein
VTISIFFALIAFITIDIVFAKEQIPQKIVVLDLRLDLSFANASTPDDQAVAKNASDRLRTEISRNTQYAVLDQSQVVQVLKSIKAKGSKCATDACEMSVGLEVGKILDADRIVIGKVVKISTLIAVVTARMVDIKTGKTLREEAFELKGNFPEIVPTGMPALSRRILDESEESLQH